MSDFRKFTLSLMAAFGVPWLLLIIIPVIKYQHLQPVPYNKEVDGVEGYYPPAGIHRQGQLVYAREGCVQCHSQMIRPAQLALDAWRKGWGQDQEARPATPVRSNTLRDYLNEPYAYLGTQRIGPDLANAGWRFTDRLAVHRQLYAPRSVDDWSVMPSFKHLYIVRKQQGPVAANALQLTGKYAPKKGYEVIPTPEAEALADYVLSLKKDYPVPGVTAALAAAEGAAKK
jgi:cytochrome c oxidase cbb3-type subunit 2